MFICSVVFGVFGQEANEQEPTTSLRGVSRPSASATTKQSLRLQVANFAYRGIEKSVTSALPTCQRYTLAPN